MLLFAYCGCCRNSGVYAAKDHFHLIAQARGRQYILHSNTSCHFLLKIVGKGIETKECAKECLQMRRDIQNCTLKKEQKHFLCKNGAILVTNSQKAEMICYCRFFFWPCCRLLLEFPIKQNIFGTETKIFIAFFRISTNFQEL